MKNTHYFNKLKMKSAIHTVAFLFIFVFSANAQEAKFQEKVETVTATVKVDPKSGKKYYDNGYIKVELTGDRTTDDNNISAAKENLAKTNPELYRKMIMSYPGREAKVSDEKDLPAANPELNKSMNKDNKLLHTPVDNKSVLPASNPDLNKKQNSGAKLPAPANVTSVSPAAN